MQAFSFVVQSASPLHWFIPVPSTAVHLHLSHMLCVVQSLLDWQFSVLVASGMQMFPMQLAPVVYTHSQLTQVRPIGQLLSAGSHSSPMSMLPFPQVS
jgi:hypothetical protein